MWGAQALLEVRRRFLVGSGQPSMLMLVRSAAALATAWKSNCGNEAAFSREMCLVSKYLQDTVLGGFGYGPVVVKQDHQVDFTVDQ